jgi:hypothetical protein
MSKGSIEWEHSREEGLVIRIKPADMDKAGELMHKAMAANQAALITLRTLLDLAIQRMAEKGEAAPKGGEKIKVE